MTDFTVVIPARYASSRFPGKALADIAGKPMVVRVAERAAQSGAKAVYVATDDPRIENAMRAHGIEAIATGAEHATGTDRIAEAVRKLALGDDAIVVNVQGDEPLIDPRLVADVAAVLAGAPEAAVPGLSPDPRRRGDLQSQRGQSSAGCEGFRPVFQPRADSLCARRVERRRRGRCSCRPALLPAHRYLRLQGGFSQEVFAPGPEPAGGFEALEQLRVLWHGYRIVVSVSETASAPGGYA